MATGERMEVIAQLLEFALNKNKFQQTLREFMEETGSTPEDIAQAAAELAALTGDDPFTDLDEMSGI